MHHINHTKDDLHTYDWYIFGSILHFIHTLPASSAGIDRFTTDGQKYGSVCDSYVIEIQTPGRRWRLCHAPHRLRPSSELNRAWQGVNQLQGAFGYSF